MCRIEDGGFFYFNVKIFFMNCIVFNIIVLFGKFISNMCELVKDFYFLFFIVLFLMNLIENDN